MIISASRRTDLPAFYADWLIQRVQQGYVLVRNPRNPHRIMRISLSTDVVDGMVFWTKNPMPLMPHLHHLDAYSYYFQFTLTPYGRDAEPRLPDKREVLIPAFQRLSSLIGSERMVWRYDPIFFSPLYTPDEHCRRFKAMAQQLEGCTNRCTVSFLDTYRCMIKSSAPLRIEPESQQHYSLLERFVPIAAQHGITLDTCAEALDASSLNIQPAHCIDRARLERISGYSLSIARDANQRPACGCAASIDIGTYDTCPNGCLYCYANHSSSSVVRNHNAHNPNSALLFGEIGPQDVIYDRPTRSNRSGQISFFK